MATFLEPNIPISEWTRIPSENLQDILNSLYWESVTRELGTVIQSLKRLKEVQPLPEEENVAKRVASEAAYFAAIWSECIKTIWMNRSI
jgi:hypothetical protein